VAGRVDFENIDVAALSDLDAGVALAAGIGRGTLDAVERPRQDARGRGLADAPGARNGSKTYSDNKPSHAR